MDTCRLPPRLAEGPREAQPPGHVPAASGCGVGRVSKAKALGAYVLCLLHILSLSREPPEINVFYTMLLLAELISLLDIGTFSLSFLLVFRPRVVVVNSDLPSVTPAARKSLQFKSVIFPSLQLRKFSGLRRRVDRCLIVIS